MVPMPMRIPAGALLCIPIFIGAMIMAACDAPVARWGLHSAIGVGGLLSYIAITRAPKLSEDARRGAAVLGFLLIASTQLSGGIDGVHRWLQLGALRIHPSALLGPALLMFAASHRDARPALTHAFLLSVQALHVLQPDAGQATAFGAAAIAILAPRLTAPNVLLALAYGSSIAGAWLRPDPLPPAPFVEDIFARAFQLGPAVGAVAVISLVPAILSPWLVTHPDTLPTENQPPARALGVYFVISSLVVLIGEFPVPLLGFGPSPALGAFFGLAALQRLCQHIHPSRDADTGAGTGSRASSGGSATTDVSRNHTQRGACADRYRAPEHVAPLDLINDGDA